MTYVIQMADGSALFTEDYNVALAAVPENEREDFRLAVLRVTLQETMERIGEKN